VKCEIYRIGQTSFKSAVQFY
jgi:hypothetical protein